MDNETYNYLLQRADQSLTEAKPLAALEIIELMQKCGASSSAVNLLRALATFQAGYFIESWLSTERAASDPLVGQAAKDLKGNLESFLVKHVATATKQPVGEVVVVSASELVKQNSPLVRVVRAQLLPKLSLYEQKDGILVGDEAWYWDGGYTFLSDAFPSGSPSSPYPRLTLLPDITKLSQRELDGEYAPLCQLWSKNYYHWLLEQFPRAILLEQNNFRGSYILRHDAPNFCRDSLRALGITDDRIVTFDPSRELIRVSSLLFFDPLPVSTVECQQSGILNVIRNELRALVQADARKASRRIYLRRTTTRKVTNEAELLETLAPWGFEVVSCDHLPFLEQLALFSEAECVLSSHGAGLANTIVAPTGMHLLELFGQGYVNPCVLPIVELGKFRYSMVPEYQPGSAAAPANGDMTAFTYVIKILLESSLPKK